MRFAIFHGLSDNAFKRLDISDARELVGYAPEDDFAAMNPATQDRHLHEVLESAAQGRNPEKSGLRDEL